MIFISQKYLGMKDSFVELLKLLLPEIIVNYFLWKGEEVLCFYLRKINSVTKEYRQCKLESKRFFNQITAPYFPIREHQVYTISFAEDDSMKTSEK